MSTSAMGKPTASVWRTAARIIGFGLIGSIALALAGFVEALIVFPAFKAVERGHFPSTGRYVITAVSSGLPGVQAVVGIVIGGIAFAFLGILGSKRQNAPRFLGRSLIDALLGTSVGVVAGVLGGLALGWSIAQNPQALFMGNFYGSLLGFLLGLVISMLASTRRKGGAMREGHWSGTVSSERRRIVLASLAVGYIATCVGILTLRRRDEGHHVPELTRTRTGQAAPAFRVKTLAGDLFDSASQRRGPMLVNFFTIPCGPCLLEFARLEPEVWKRYKDRGLSIIAIGTGHEESDLGEFRSENGLSFPIAADPEQQVAGRFAVPAVPGNYLISIEGRITYQSVGYTEAEFSKLVAAIERELPEP